MERFEKGETAFYREMGAILKVEVAERTVDGGCIDYRLRVLEVLRDSPHRGITFNVNEELECTACDSFDTSPLKAFSLSRNI